MHLIAANRMADRYGNRVNAGRLLVGRAADVQSRNVERKRAVELLEGGQRDDALRSILCTK